MCGASHISLPRCLCTDCAHQHPDQTQEALLLPLLWLAGALCRRQGFAMLCWLDPEFWELRVPCRPPRVCSVYPNTLHRLPGLVGQRWARPGPMVSCGLPRMGCAPGHRTGVEPPMVNFLWGRSLSWSWHLFAETFSMSLSLSGCCWLSGVPEFPFGPAHGLKPPSSKWPLSSVPAPEPSGWSCWRGLGLATSLSHPAEVGSVRPSFQGPGPRCPQPHPVFYH